LEALRPTFERVARLASTLAGEARANVILVGEDGTWHANPLPNSQEITKDRSFAAEAVRTGRALWVADTFEDSRFRDHPFVADYRRVGG
ncbi:hypothetical protein, partial [Priestia megaterium]|uniref:hypothetical protein n=1 Tax=Priestia megaterium TaxID=1404 RepID=UPI0035B69E00